MEKLETVFNIGKLGVLVFFIVAGLLLGQLEWSRFEPVNWAPISDVVATGMLGFLAYEGFELISNASADIDNPKRTLPIAILGSVIIAIVIYVLAFTVAIGHLSFDAVAASRDFAASAAAGTFLGPIGFAIMTAGAVPRVGVGDQCRLFRRRQTAANVVQERRASFNLPAQDARSIGDEPAGHRPSCAVCGEHHRHPCIVRGDQRRLSRRLCGSQYRGDPVAA